MRIGLSLCALIGITGCPGAAPPNTGGNPDAPGPDADETPTALMLTGKAMDYFGAVAIQDAMIETDGLQPAVMTTSGADGAYQIEVAVGSKLFLLANKATYRPTRNQPLTIADVPVTQDAYLMSQQDVRNQYTAAGVLPVAGTAIIVAELRRGNNQPLEGIPRTNVQLLDANNVAVPGIVGPFFFNAAGSVDPQLMMATAYQGRSRVAVLDVPPGTYTLAVTYPQGAGNQTNNTPLTTTSDGGTLVLSGGGTPGGGGNLDPLFTTDIYPKLQRAAAGGLGCANCHTLTGPAAVLKYDEPAATVLASIMARPGVINATTPAESFLLKRPLYEAPPTPQDHPNATFLDVNDADYKLFLLWIMNGAKP